MKKYVLVTGANGGIGRQIVTRLLENGYEVISLDINNSNLKELNTTFIKCDVTNKEDINHAYQEVKKVTDNFM